MTCKCGHSKEWHVRLPGNTECTHSSKYYSQHIGFNCSCTKYRPRKKGRAWLGAVLEDAKKSKKNWPEWAKKGREA